MPVQADKVLKNGYRRSAWRDKVKGACVIGN
jgi:hypothetical protein